jgi:hypothetical protein
MGWLPPGELLFMSYCSIQAGVGRLAAVHMVNKLTAVTGPFRGFTNAPLDDGIFRWCDTMSQLILMAS